MADQRIALRLNQQQRELLDKTVGRGEASDRNQLVRRALREFAVANRTRAGASASHDESTR